MGKKKNKKFDFDADVHSCPKCRDYEPHIRRLHEERLNGLARTKNNSVVLDAIRKFEANMGQINQMYLEQKRNR